MKYTTTEGRSLELSKLTTGGLLAVIAELPNVNLEPDETGELMLVALNARLAETTDEAARKRMVAEFLTGDADAAAVLAIMRQAAAPIRVLISHVAGLFPTEVDKLDVLDALQIVSAWLTQLDGLSIIQKSIDTGGRLGEIMNGIRSAIK